MMKLLLPFLSLLLLFFCGCGTARTSAVPVNKGAEPAGIPVKDAYLNATVKLSIVTCTQDFRLPWQNHIQNKLFGTGVYIGNGRILTAAHLVGDSTCITVYRCSDGALANASVIAENPQNDLALLEIKDKEFFRNIPPLLFGEVPPAGTAVLFAAYPPESDLLSVTEGIISRVELQYYHHSGMNLPAAQFDADFAPGMDGGGIICNDRLIGIAFQGNTKGEGLGYMIPSSVIRHFLRDAADGTVDGYGVIGFSHTDLINPDARDYRKMKKGESGLFVTKVLPKPGFSQKLRAGDVILSMDGHTVTNDGFLRKKDGTLIQLGVHLAEKQLGDKTELVILRNGRRKKVTLPMQKMKPAVPLRPVRGRTPYFVRGGLVFTTLNTGVLAETDGHVSGLPDKPAEKNVTEYVVLTAVLSDKVNMGYEGLAPSVLDKINGTEVRSVAHAQKLTDECRDRYIVFGFRDGSAIILDTQKMRESDKRIRLTHGIPDEKGY